MNWTNLWVDKWHKWLQARDELASKSSLASRQRAPLRGASKFDYLYRKSNPFRIWPANPLRTSTTFRCTSSADDGSFHSPSLVRSMSSEMSIGPLKCLHQHRSPISGGRKYKSPKYNFLQSLSCSNYLERTCTTKVDYRLYG